MCANDGLEIVHALDAELCKLSVEELERSLVGDLGVCAVANLLYVAGGVPDLAAGENKGSGTPSKTRLN